MTTAPHQLDLAPSRDAVGIGSDALVSTSSMKYIKLKHRGFVLFEETQSHAEIAKALGDEVESAGFAHATEWCEDGKICCSGESQTLGKHCHETDTDRLRQRLARC